MADETAVALRLVVLDPAMEIRREAAGELVAIYARHEEETASFFESLRERLRTVGLTEKQIFDEVMEVIRAAAPSSREYASDDE